MAKARRSKRQGVIARRAVDSLSMTALVSEGLEDVRRGRTTRHREAFRRLEAWLAERVPSR